MSDQSFKFAITTIEAAIIAIGIVGNLISIIIFSRKTFRSNSISTYCIALSIFDCAILIQLIVDIYSLMYGKYLPDQSNELCKFVFSTTTFLASIQPWITVAFSLDKLLSMRANAIAILKKKCFQWTIVAGIVIVSVCLYLYIAIAIRLGEIFPGYFICDLTSLSLFKEYMIIILLESCLIPFIAMLIISILTIRMLIKSRNSVERIGNMSKDRRSRDKKYAISSMTLNIMFIICRLPGSTFYILFSFYSYFDLYLYSFSSLLFYLNSSLGFFVHMLTNSLFRREFLMICRFKRSGETILSNTNMNSRTNLAIRKNQVSVI